MFELINISKAYRGAEILRSVSLGVQSGECLGVVGENGCGKSTLLRIAAGADKNFSGDIRAEGESVRKNRLFYRDKLAYVPQELALAEYLTVAQQVKFWQKAVSAENIEILELLKIHEMYKKRISELSGGQQKRLSIALALQSEAQVIVMDEASAALDLQFSEIILQYLIGKKASGSAILWCSHDHGEIPRICDRVIKLENGNISL